MKLLTMEIQKGIPELYATEDVKDADKMVWVKFFAHWRWYAVEAHAICETMGEDEPKNIYLPLSEFRSVIDSLDTFYDTHNYGTVFVKDVLFFGWVSGFEKEWGYFGLAELKSIGAPPFGLGIERDMYGNFPKRLGDTQEWKSA